MKKSLSVLSFTLISFTLGTSLSTAQLLSGSDTSISVDVDSSLVDSSGNLVDDTTVTIGGQSGSDSLLNVDTTGSPNQVEVLPYTIGDNEVIIRLFGNSAGGTTGTVDVTLGSNEGDATVTLFGSGAGNGSSGSSSSGAAAGGGSSGGGSGSAGRTAAVAGGGASCFTPDATQLTHLLNRNSQSVAASISQVSVANVVIIEMCQDSQAQVSQAIGSDANSSAIRNAVAANASIVQALTNAGRGPNHVLAVDTNGSQATVYTF